MWLHKDSEYATKVDQAMEEAVDVLEAVARKRAIVGSDVLLIFLLKGHRPEKYRERHEVQHKAKIEVEERGDALEVLRDAGCRVDQLLRHLRPLLFPALSPHVIDDVGVTLIGNWIDSL